MEKNSIEQQFFKAFGIEPYKFDGVYYHHIEYPQITSEILLQLICIWNNYTNCADELIIPMDFENLKENVLERFVTPTLYDCDIDNEWLNQQVQSLFTEVKNG